MFSWTNNSQALSSPLNDAEGDEKRRWYVRKECTRLKYGGALKETLPSEAGALYYVLAHMTNPNLQLFVDGKRIDEVWTAEHRRALADYNANWPHMHRRYLQADCRTVIWHDEAGRRATIWNFAPRTCRLPGRVEDLFTGTAVPALPPAGTYRLEPWHTYAVTGAEALPRVLE